MMLYSLKVLSDLSSIRDNMDVIYQIYSAKDESTKADLLGICWLRIRICIVF
jgi:hypothetical protein